MKKLKTILVAILAVLALAPNTFATVASSYAVEIKSVEPEVLAGNPTVSDPAFSGLEMDLNISFLAPNDSVKYKITIKNNTDKEYTLSEETPFDDSDYITFTYELDSDTLKAHGEAIAYLTLTYANAVPASEIGTNGYTLDNKATIKFVDQNGETVNPNTIDSSRGFIVVAAIAATIMFAFVLLFSRRRNFAKRGIFGLVLVFCAIPLIASAAEKLSLSVNVHISIVAPKYEITYVGDESYHWYSVAKYEFEEGNCYDSYGGATAIYVGTKTDANKYLFCNFPIVKKGAHLAGATAQVEEIAFEYIGIADSLPCTDEEDGSTVCPSSEIRTFDSSESLWRYELGIAGDKEAMSFSAIDYEEEHGNAIWVRPPETFTMPNHDVVFRALTR